MKKQLSDKSYLIGQVAKMAKVNIETIRYYERAGIMPAPQRSAGNQRIYNLTLVNRLRYIRRSRELGFSLKEITELIELDDAEMLTCDKVHLVATKHLRQVEKKIADLQQTSRVLTKLTEQCSRGEVPDCPITDALYQSEDS